MRCAGPAGFASPVYLWTGVMHTHKPWNLDTGLPEKEETFSTEYPNFREILKPNQANEKPVKALS